MPTLLEEYTLANDVAFRGRILAALNGWAQRVTTLPDSVLVSQSSRILPAGARGRTADGVRAVATRILRTTGVEAQRQLAAVTIAAGNLGADELDASSSDDDVRNAALAALLSLVDTSEYAP